MKRLLGLAVILAVSGCAAIAQEQAKKEEPVVAHAGGFGPEINGILLTAGITFAGWLGGQTAKWGIKSQAAEFKETLMTAMDEKIEKAIAVAEKLEGEKCGRQLDAIHQALHNLSGKLDDSKASIERRLRHCEEDIKGIEGNMESIVPTVNQIIGQTFGNYGVTPAGQVLRRKNGPPSNPTFYSTEGHLE